MLDCFVVLFKDFTIGCVFCGSENYVLDACPLVHSQRKKVKIIIQKNPIHQQMIKESLTKATRRDNNESGAEQADNWIHVTPRAKERANTNNHSLRSSKSNMAKGKGPILGKAPKSYNSSHMEMLYPLLQTL